MISHSRNGTNAPVLLIQPPFTSPKSPSFTVPILASFLESRNVPVSGFDLNREFFFRFLNRKNIVDGKKYVWDRFRELNARSRLIFSRFFEYWELYKILAEIEAKNGCLAPLSFPFFDFEDIQDSLNSYIFLKLPFLPYYPETFFIQPEVRFCYAFDEFASADILRCAQKRYFYSAMLESILTELITERKPRIIGFSVTFQQQVFPAFQCARFINRTFPDIHITMGGAFISVHFRELKEKAIFELTDSLILDEGEIGLEQLSRELAGRNADFSQIPGMVYLEKDIIHFNPPAPPMDFAKCPPPKYSVFELDKYFRKKDKIYVPFRLSKGCSWQKCTFCRTDMYFCKDYQQPPDDLVYEHLLVILNDSGFTKFHFSDEASDPDTLAYISKRLLKENVNIDWYFHTRVSKKLDRELGLLFAKSGCRAMAMGIESLNDRVLMLMKKGVTTRLVDHVLNRIDGVIPITAYMIVGFPTETRHETLKSFKKIKDYLDKKLISSVDINMFMLFHGSDIWNNPQKYDVSEKRFQPGQDLLPDTAQFAGAGMSRQDAFELFVSLMKRMKGNTKMKTAVKVNDKSVRLRYCLDDFMAIYMKDGWRLLNLPLGKWLEEQDNTTPAIRANS